MKILQSNPGANYRAHMQAIDAAVKEVMSGGWYILGKQVAAFEEEFASFLGAGHAVGVASGTDAVALALRGLDIGPGDEVITVSHTAVATVAAIELIGATPVLADIDADTFTIDPATVEQLITNRTKAVIAVHLYGRPADLAPLLSLTSSKGIHLVEDCAQCHGAYWNGRRTGTWGVISSFSFYPTKNLGAIGDGGAVVTNDPAIATKLKQLREYGWAQRYISDMQGMNSRLDELQAAILRVKLRSLDDENERRRRIASVYDRTLASSGLLLPGVAPNGSTHVYHQYVVRSSNRDTLKTQLAERGIGTLIHYPVPIHMQPAYKGRVRCAPSMQNTERVAREILSLPVYPELEDNEVQFIGDAVKQVATGT